MGHDHSTGDMVLHWAGAYDVLTFVLTLGRERQFRDRQIDLARLAPGESVLDIGCGTGSLALAARRRVGGDARVCGVDPSPEMVARARRKAAKAGLAVTFEEGSAAALPFPDGTFDAVLSSLMLHHLTDEVRQKAVHEVARVLKPGGRFLGVDLGGGPQAKTHGLVLRRHRHGDFDLASVTPPLENAGLRIVDRGPVGPPRVIGLPELHFVLAEASASP